MPNCCRNRRGRSVGLCAEVRHSIAHSMTREQFGLSERVVSSTKLSVLGIRSHRQAQGAPDTFARILYTLTCPYRSPEAEAEPHRIASKPNSRLRRRQMFARRPWACRRVEEDSQVSHAVLHTINFLWEACSRRTVITLCHTSTKVASNHYVLTWLEV